MKSIATLTVALALAVVGSKDIRAQNQEISPPQPQVPAAAMDYEALATGPQFTSGAETYVIMPGVQAVKAPLTGEGLQQALDAQSVSGQALAQKGPFVIYRTDLTQAGATRSALAVQQVRTGAAQPVVYNPRTHQIGIVLGTLIVHLANMDDADAVGQAAGVTLGQRFEQLGIAVYAVDAGQDILAAAQSLQGDARVQSVQIEVLENLNRPQ